jgi:DNA-binding response OmpR family regulator
MPAHHFLLVSPHQPLTQVLGDTLGLHHKLSIADSAEHAVHVLHQDHCEAVLLDARSLDFCPSIRTKWDGPIILLVPPDSKDTILPGYGSGVDMHVCVPCDTRELVARVESVMRRQGTNVNR